MATIDLQTRFREDARAGISDARKAFVRMQGDSADQDLIHQIFRHIHSIKSEAAYLNFKGIERSAHGIESNLEAIRKGSDGSAYFEKFRDDLQALETLIDQQIDLQKNDFPLLNQFEKNEHRAY